MNASYLPRVSIGMPVFNGENTIGRAIDSILAQTFTDFELIISDNASTDGTELVCRGYAEKDKRIRYVRQPQNRGALENFNFVLDQAVGELFMWAAADDCRSLDYLEKNVEFLDGHPEYVASTSPTYFDASDIDQVRMGDSSLEADDRLERVSLFFTGWHANGRFYSLFRRKVLAEYEYRSDDYLAADWGWVINAALVGKLKRVESGWVHLGRMGHSNTTNVFAPYNKDLVHFLVPFGPLFQRTLLLCERIPIKVKCKLFAKWVRLSLQAIRLNLSWSLGIAAKSGSRR